MKKILIIQTAFIGDVILATSLVELVKKNEPDSEIHFLLRSGNEVLLKNNPHIKKIWTWNKKEKYKSLFSNIKEMRKIHFDYIFNIQRFFNSGFMSALLHGTFKSSFKENPLSFFCDKRVPHKISKAGEKIIHEVERNAELLPYSWKKERQRPQIYFETPEPNVEKMIVLAPCSVWKTKEWPIAKWKDLAHKLVENGYTVSLIGAPSDFDICEGIKEKKEEIINYCGKLTLYESADLMRRASRVIANDSAALHLASAVNAPSTGVFCSTTKRFGFFGLSDDSITIEKIDMKCKPCGLHGKKECPLKHFDCGEKLSVEKVLKMIIS